MHKTKTGSRSRSDFHVLTRLTPLSLSRGILSPALPAPLAGGAHLQLRRGERRISDFRILCQSSNQNRFIHDTISSFSLHAGRRLPFQTAARQLFTSRHKISDDAVCDFKDSLQLGGKLGGRLKCGKDIIPLR